MEHQGCFCNLTLKEFMLSKQYEAQMRADIERVAALKRAALDSFYHHTKETP
jgi:hypothetical protein